MSSYVTVTFAVTMALRWLLFLSDPDLIIVSPCLELTDSIFLKRENVTRAAENTNYYNFITLMLKFGQIIRAADWSRLKAEDFVEFLQAEDQFSYKLLIESSTQSLFGLRQCLSPKLWLWWQAKQKCSGSIFYLQHWWRMKFSFWLQLLRLKRSRCVILFFICLRRALLIVKNTL